MANAHLSPIAHTRIGNFTIALYVVWNKYFDESRDFVGFEQEADG